MSCMPGTCTPAVGRREPIEHRDSCYREIGSSTTENLGCGGPTVQRRPGGHCLRSVMNRSGGTARRIAPSRALPGYHRPARRSGCQNGKWDTRVSRPRRDCLCRKCARCRAVQVEEHSPLTNAETMQTCTIYKTFHVTFSQFSVTSQREQGPHRDDQTNFKVRIPAARPRAL